MRYYSFKIKADADNLQSNLKISLKRHYYSSNDLAKINEYFYKNLENEVFAFVYRNEGDIFYHSFAYNEKRYTFSDIYEQILGMVKFLYNDFILLENPYEVTTTSIMEHLNDAARRDYHQNSLIHCMRAMGAECYREYYRENNSDYLFKLEEIMISDNKSVDQVIYDKSFLDECENIENHVNNSAFSGNMVHYVISSRSVEAAKDMVGTLTRKLYKANRIQSGRMLIVSDIAPLFYKNHYIDRMIETNSGGVIVFDLTERFGKRIVEYKMTSQYIEKLLKKYKNECLFVFTYNMDHPGFSYELLPKLQRYIIPISLREGTGDRKMAINYLENLIKESEYQKYADQADTFMQAYPGDTFTQTDVLTAFEKFEPWCINKNIVNAYNYSLTDIRYLDRDENVTSSKEKLENMIGLSIVKEQIHKVLAADLVEKERKKYLGNSYHGTSMHMIFGGNPGTAKTTVAKLFAGIAKEEGVLQSGAFVECSGTDLICDEAVRNMFSTASGGVLFIDEAYSIPTDMAITALLQEMENRRDEVIVILAGYNENMKQFLSRNVGLESRIPHWIRFPDYSTEELMEIFKMMLSERKMVVTEEATRHVNHILDRIRYKDNFGNGRFVRNLIERAEQNQSVRLLNSEKEVSEISKEDLFLLIKEDFEIAEENQEPEKPEGQAKKTLDEMIGLSSAKQVINKAIAHFKLRKICLDKGISKDKASMHMVFTGNPGTAKTTVARLFAGILRDEKVLPTGKFVEVGRADLVGKYVGSTAPKVKKCFQDAKGGVLFIDEAYSLCDNCKNGFGDEAITTIVQEMENHRDDVIVVFAGYPDQMQEFLERNPGMSSRIAFHVNFENYTVEELCSIAKLMVANKHMTITDQAMEKLKKHFENAIDNKAFGNGRFVRNRLEEAEMNIAQRISHMDESEITEKLITTIEACDIEELKVENEMPKQKFGFAV